MDKPIVRLPEDADAAAIIGLVVDALICDEVYQGLGCAVFVGRCAELHRFQPERYTPVWLRVLAADFVCIVNAE